MTEVPEGIAQLVDQYTECYGSRNDLEEGVMNLGFRFENPEVFNGPRENWPFWLFGSSDTECWIQKNTRAWNRMLRNRISLSEVGVSGLAGFLKDEVKKAQEREYSGELFEGVSHGDFITKEYAEAILENIVNGQAWL